MNINTLALRHLTFRNLSKITWDIFKEDIGHWLVEICIKSVVASKAGHDSEGDSCRKEYLCPSVDPHLMKEIYMYCMPKLWNHYVYWHQYTIDKFLNWNGTQKQRGRWSETSLKERNMLVTNWIKPIFIFNWKTINSFQYLLVLETN